MNEFNHWIELYLLLIHHSILNKLASTSNQEPFDLSAWLVNRLGLDVNSEDEKNRLNELIAAFRKAGYRKLDAVQILDNEDLAGIDSELESKLKPGEKKLLKKNL